MLYVHSVYKYNVPLVHQSSPAAAAGEAFGFGAGAV